MQTVSLDTLSLPSIPVVDTAEIAFAMALFDAAKDGKVHAADIAHSGFPLLEGTMEGFEPDLDLSGPRALTNDDSPGLSRAISILWHHYHGDDRQRTIWSRVVAFQAMMAGGEGWLTQPFAQPSSSNTTASASAAIVNAVAVEPLLEFGQFDPLRFREAVDRFTDPLPKASVSALPAAEMAVHFGVAESLLRPVESISGRGAVESLLSRALAMARVEFPWLDTVCFKGNACFVPVSSMDQLPTAAQIDAAETALIRSLVGLLRNIVGQRTTLNLVKSLSSESMPDAWFDGLSV